MNNPEIEALIIVYLDSPDGSKEQKDLRKKLLSHGVELNELESFEKLNNNLPNLSVPESSLNLQQRFYSMLEKESKSNLIIEPSLRIFIKSIRQFFSTYAFKLSYTVVLLFIGWGIGRETSKSTETNYQDQLSLLSKEVQEMKGVIQQISNNNISTSEKIKAVDNSQNYTEPSSEIIEVLIRTLYEDEDVNVRLAAVDALTHFGESYSARNGILASLTTEENPIVQISLIESLVMLDEKRAIKPLQKMLKQENLYAVVKFKVEEGLSILI